MYFIKYFLIELQFLLLSRHDHMVRIYDRHGEPRDEISLPGLCSGMAWDKDGDVLAIINEKSPNIVLWNAHTGKSSHLDSSDKEAK